MAPPVAATAAGGPRDPLLGAHLDGQLHVFARQRESPGIPLCCFISSLPVTDKPTVSPPAPAPPVDYLIFLSGLDEGLMAVNYVPKLSACLGAAGVQLVQPLLTSAYSTWGTGSVACDAEEIIALLAYLDGLHAARRTASAPPARVALVGCSTGCQDIVAVLRALQPCAPTGSATAQDPQKDLKDGSSPAALSSSEHATPQRSTVDALGMISHVMLHAPVSDREWWETQPEFSDVQAQAQKLVADGHGDELLPRGTTSSRAPISADRFLALTDRLGPEDQFSSDLTDDDLERVLSPLAYAGNVSIVLAGADEYVPAAIDKHALAARFTLAVERARARLSAVGGAGAGVAGKQLAESIWATVVEGATHGMENHVDEFLAVVHQRLGI